MFWSPPGYTCGDITIIRVGEEYHLFTEQFALEPKGDLFGERTIGHYASSDLLAWEALPPVCGTGEPGSFDAFTLYHNDAYVHDGKWYVHYTALDIKGAGQRQSVGLCMSDDGLHFKKIGNGPVLEADPRWYEQAIPDEACYQEKDRARLWFRDPAIIRDPTTGKFGLTIIARDIAKHPDTRGCLAWATSDDLINWEPKPPIFSPDRFHTIETPSIFEHDGRHYIIYMSHRHWGGPVLANDPYQDNGNFYAFSESGPEGPYVTPGDEVLVAAHHDLRLGAQRTFDGPDGQRWHYGWLSLSPATEQGDIDPGLAVSKVMPLPRPVRFAANGEMHVMASPMIDDLTRAQPLDLQLTRTDAQTDWRVDGDKIHAKQLRGRSIALLGNKSFKGVVFSAKVQMSYGCRAGLVVRADEAANSGWFAIADHRYGRVEFTLPNRELFIDARKWQKRDEYDLKVIANQYSVEIYVDDRLMIQNVRHREQVGRLGLLVENADVTFSDLKLRTFSE